MASYPDRFARGDGREIGERITLNGTPTGRSAGHPSDSVFGVGSSFRVVPTTQSLFRIRRISAADRVRQAYITIDVLDVDINGVIRLFAVVHQER